MSAFSLRLHYRNAVDPVEEQLDVTDEDEARELARVRLLLTGDFDRVELRHGGRALESFARDGATPA